GEKFRRCLTGGFDTRRPLLTRTFHPGGDVVPQAVKLLLREPASSSVRAGRLRRRCGRHYSPSQVEAAVLLLGCRHRPPYASDRPWPAGRPDWACRRHWARRLQPAPPAAPVPAAGVVPPRWPSRTCCICWKLKSAPSCSTTNAPARSPSLRSGIATIATSATSGWVYSSCSISETGIFSPPRLITSRTRPVIRRYPASS